MLQKLVRLLAKDRARQIDVRALCVVALMQGKIEALVLVPTGHQGDVALLAGGEDLRRRARQKPSIDDRAEAEPRRSRKDRVGGRGTQFGKRTRSDLAHEVDPAASASSSDAGARLGDANMAPLSPMTRANSPLASGETISALAA
jgi:hypothetical protein